MNVETAKQIMGDLPAIRNQAIQSFINSGTDTAKYLKY